MELELLTTFNGNEERLKPEWDKLVDSSGANVFARFAFNHNIEKIFGDIAQPRIYLAYKKGKLVGIAPLAKENGILRFITGLDYIGAADYCDFVANPENRQEFYDAIQEILKDNKFDLREVREDSQTLRYFESVGAKIDDKSTCAATYLEGDFETFLERLKSPVRRDYRRFQREFPNARLKRVATEQDLEEVRARFIEMHQKTWQSKGETGNFGGDERFSRFGQYHKQVTRELLADGNLAFMQLKDGADALAIDYCFDDKDTFYVYSRSITDDPRYKRFSPGKVMTLYLIDEAMKKGKKVFDLMRGDEPYKNDFNVTWSTNKNISSID